MLIPRLRSIARRPVVLAGLVGLLAGVRLPILGGDGGASLGDIVSVLLVLVATREWWLGRATISAPGAVAFGGIVVAIALSTLGSSIPDTSVVGAARWLQEIVLVPLSVAVVARRPDDLRVLGGFFVGGAVIQGAVGVEQYLTGTGAVIGGQPVRAVGTFGASNITGMSVAVAVGLLVSLAALVTARTRRTALLWLACTAFLAVPLALSFSRGTWMAVAAGGAVVVLARSRRLFAVLACAAVVAATLLVLVMHTGGTSDNALERRVSSLGSVTSSQADQSVDDRYELWAAAGRMWSDHPVLGVGIRGFPAFRDSSASLDLSSGSDTQGAGQGYVRQPLTSPHSLYFLVLSETGIVGVVALAALLLALALGTLRRTTTVAGTPDEVVGLAALGLVVFLVVNFVYSDLGGPSTLVVVTALGAVTGWALVRPASPP